MYIGVALSGGLDSFSSLMRLKEARHTVIALHGLFFDKEESLLEDEIRKIRESLDRMAIPLEIVDGRDAFRRHVLDPFFAAFYRGETPNPCALCNRRIKFGMLLEHAKSLGADAFATGHYACLEREYDHIMLSKAMDLTKDQSYFLSLVQPDALPHILFPLSQTTKDACRLEAQKKGLAIPNPVESQDICFLPRDTPLPSFLMAHWEKEGRAKPEEGPIFLSTPAYREVGVHKGLFRYTEGQRRGLGISYEEGLYVLKKDIEKNALIIGPKRFLGMIGLEAQCLSLFIPKEYFPKKTWVKVRFRQKPYAADVTLEDSRLCIRFSEPVFPSACGQLASVMDEKGRILCGGIIDKIVYPEKSA